MSLPEFPADVTVVREMPEKLAAMVDPAEPFAQNGSHKGRLNP